MTYLFTIYYCDADGVSGTDELFQRGCKVVARYTPRYR